MAGRGESGRDVLAGEDVVWHDVECGAYSADLPLWEELAREAGGPVLELGCGTGRVALHLARRGIAVTALDHQGALVGALRSRAQADRLAVSAAEADARDFDLADRFALVIGAMQFPQLVDPPGRRRMLASVSRHLAPAGLAAFALLEGGPDDWSAGPDAPPPLPDVHERDGWVYSSLPIGLERRAGRVVVRRLRQTVSPAGELEEGESVDRLVELSPAELEADAQKVGLRPAGRREIPATDSHLGSTVVVLSRHTDERPGRRP